MIRKCGGNERIALGGARSGSRGRGFGSRRTVLSAEKRVAGDQRRCNEQEPFHLQTFHERATGRRRTKIRAGAVISTASTFGIHSIVGNIRLVEHHGVIHPLHHLLLSAGARAVQTHRLDGALEDFLRSVRVKGVGELLPSSLRAFLFMRSSSARRCAASWKESVRGSPLYRQHTLATRLRTRQAE